MVASETSIYPLVGGTEEETRASFEVMGSNRDALKSSEVSMGIMRHIDPFCAPLGNNTAQLRQFRQNGSRIYRDVEIELATPECVTPQQQATYIKADAELLIAGAGHYLQACRERGKGVSAITFQRRLVDNSGNAWGCHDNCSVHEPGYGLRLSEQLEPLWKVYLSTRGILYGAGLINKNGMHFSQKMAQSHAYMGHGYKPSLISYRSSATPDDARLEVRCSDINIKDWPTVNRLGDLDLVVAGSQTPLCEALVKSCKQLEEFNMQRLNELPLDANLNIIKTKGLQVTIDIQRRIMEMLLEDLAEQGGQAIPEHLEASGKQALEYLDDFERVLCGEADLSILCDRSDWAEKLRMVRKKHRRTPLNQGIYDIRARAIDMLHDRIALTLDDKGKVVIKEGYGYRRAVASQLIAAGAVKHACVNPPPETRAAQRVAAANRLGSRLTTIGWGDILYTDEQGNDQGWHFENRLNNTVIT